MTPDPQLLAQELRAAVHRYETDRDRQSIEGRLGISDIGFCRMYATYVVRQEEPSEDPSKYAAFVGTAIGSYLETVIEHMYPTAERDMTVEVELPSGAKVEGHPDIVLPAGVIDIKTVDGLTSVRRKGASLQQRFQRQLYAAALDQAGRDIEWVGNAWWDRSARDEMPHVEVEPYDPLWMTYADEWLSEVLYAVKTGTEAPKDQPIEFCQGYCPFFSKCRGDDVLKDREGGGLIVNPDHLDAIDVYTEAQRDIRAAEKTKEDARRALAGVSGIGSGFVVKWIEVSESDVPGYTRSGYTRLDIRPLPKKVR